MKIPEAQKTMGGFGMKRNKIVAWLLCVVMMIGIMAGCGEGNTKETEKPKETGNAVETEKQQETEQAQ